MRKFFLVYRDRYPSIVQKPSAQLASADIVQKVPAQSLNATPASTLSPRGSVFRLSWSHYVFLIAIKNAEERQFYEIESAQNDWSLPELRRQFDSGLYERLALSRDKTGVLALSQQGQVVVKPSDVIKSPYVLEFLGLEERSRYSESDLESAIITKIEHFLLELGKGFLFEARQKRFTFAEEHFFVDLVFYNRLLRCYVLIDLKLGKLTHQNLGQMQMYVNYFDRFVKHDGENATIGIILCKEKTDALVELHEVFVRCVNAVMLNLPGSADNYEIENRVSRLLSLFQALSAPSDREISGLWAELFCIRYSPNISQTLTRWHSG